LMGGGDGDGGDDGGGDEEEAREERVTKRWRVGRGAVWEGYGVVVDRGVEMHGGEREGRMAVHPRSQAQSQLW
jgi:hypothetical protein